jgi:hypothetical protein
MMKKMGLVLGLLAVAAAVFAAEAVTVVSVAGRAEREISSGRWEVLKTGDSITTDTVIRTGIGAGVTLRSGEKTYTIGGVQNGKVAALGENSGGIHIEGRVAQTDTGAISRTTGRIGTASARSSDAAEAEAIIDE